MSGKFIPAGEIVPLVARDALVLFDELDWSKLGARTRACLTGRGLATVSGELTDQGRQAREAVLVDRAAAWEKYL